MSPFARSLGSCLALFLCIAAISPAQDRPRDLDSHVARLIQGNNDFAFDLYQTLSARKGNIAFSPYSISNALAMTYGGASGQTAEEMAKALRFTLPAVELHGAFAQLGTRLQKRSNKGDVLTVANSLWFQQGLPVRPEFVRLVQDQHRAELFHLNFSRESEKSRQAINQWVAEKTENKIREILQPGVVQSLTKLVLVNAVYFKGEWAISFHKQDNKQEQFYAAGEVVRPVLMMRQVTSLKYFEDSNVQVLELPYKGLRHSLLIVLPKTRNGLPGIERSLSRLAVETWCSKLQNRPVAAVLPRFAVEDQFLLRDTLVSLGMRSTFVGGDFSGMTPEKDLGLSEVVHKTYLDVSEEGTEAAAATAAIIVQPISAIPPDAPILFKADHPFLFLIRNNEDGSVLFLGRVADPTTRE